MQQLQLLPQSAECPLGGARAHATLTLLACHAVAFQLPHLKTLILINCFVFCGALIDLFDKCSTKVR